MPSLALLIFCVVAVASPSSPLTWEELRSIALEHNPSLAGSKRTSDASKTARKQAGGNFLPKVSLTADRTRSATELANLDTRKTDLHYGAKASLNLFNGFSSTASLAQAQATENELEASYWLASANLRHDLRLAYFNIYMIQERMRLYEKDLKRVQQNQKLVELKYNSGNEARWNLRKTKAELEQAKYNIRNSESQLANAREALAELLGVESLPAGAVAEPERSLLEKSFRIEESELENHPELKRSRFAEQKAAEGIRSARSGFFPSIDLSYQRIFTDSRPDNNATQHIQGTVFALTGEWNIFNGTVDFYKVQEANLNRDAAELAALSVERRLKATLRQKQENLKTATDFLPVARSLREAAEERQRLVSEQYRSGLKNYLDWEQAESQLLGTEQVEIRALGDSFTAFAELELARGLNLEQP